MATNHRAAAADGNLSTRSVPFRSRLRAFALQVRGRSMFPRYDSARRHRVPAAIEAPDELLGGRRQHNR